MLPKTVVLKVLGVDALHPQFEDMWDIPPQKPGAQISHIANTFVATRVHSNLPHAPVTPGAVRDGIGTLAFASRRLEVLVPDDLAVPRVLVTL